MSDKRKLYTAADMGLRPAVPAAPPAPTKADGRTAITIPPGGQVTLRRASNGVIATVVDANWRDREQVVAASVSDLDIRG